VKSAPLTGDSLLPPRGREDALGFSDCFAAFDEEFDYVCRALRRYGINAGDVEDVAQDVLVVVWRRWDAYDRARPLRPWLSGIAARVAHDFIKRRRREVPQSHIEIEDPGPIGEDRIEASRARGLLLAALAALPERHRTTIVLHELDGRRPTEIAERMGVPMSTAYTRIRRAREAFARALATIKKRNEHLPRQARTPGRGVARGVGRALSVVVAAMWLATPWNQARFSEGSGAAGLLADISASDVNSFTRSGDRGA
jgi:RNA polymerase sigma-70 factor (ECF subfamily)